MNILLAIVSFFLGNAKNFLKKSRSVFVRQLILNLRSILLVLVFCIGSLAVFCTSTCLFIVSIANQYEKNDAFSFSTVQAIYLFSILISFGILFYSLRRKTWLDIMEVKRTETKAPGSPIENALALLVMDFVESRKSKRHETQNSANE